MFSGCMPVKPLYFWPVIALDRTELFSQVKNYLFQVMILLLDSEELSSICKRVIQGGLWNEVHQHDIFILGSVNFY